MAFAPTPTDVSVIISVATQKGTPGDRSPAFATERRVTPTWSISQLKGKLETMCGIPPGFQRLRLKSPGREDQWLDGDDQIVGDWGLGKGCEFEVRDHIYMFYVLFITMILPERPGSKLAHLYVDLPTVVSEIPLI